jgi:hypothetical protein
MHIAVFIADRNVLTQRKCVSPKPVTGLIIVNPVRVIVKHPACMFCSAWLVDEASNLIAVAGPEPTHATMVALLLPKVRIDMALCVKGRNEFIAVVAGTIGEFLRPRKIESDTFECVGQRHEMTSGFSMRGCVPNRD